MAKGTEGKNRPGAWDWKERELGTLFLPGSWVCSSATVMLTHTHTGVTTTGNHSSLYMCLIGASS